MYIFKLLKQIQYLLIFNLHSTLKHFFLFRVNLCQLFLVIIVSVEPFHAQILFFFVYE